MVELIENLATKLNEEQKNKISKQVIDGFNADLASRSKWEEIRKTSSEMFALYREEKTEPWTGCSNVKLPMMTTAVLQFHARAYEALLPPKNICKSVPLGKENSDVLLARRTEKYMNYLLDYKMTEYRQSMDVTLEKLAIDGCVIRKTFYDPIKKRVVSDYLNASDFVINSTVRYLEDSPRHSQIIMKSVNDIKILQQRGIYLDTDIDIDVPGQNDTDSIQDQAKKNDGNEFVKNDETTPRKIIEQHTYIDTGGNNGIKEPVIVTIDYETKQILRIVSRRHPENPEEIMEYFTKFDFIPNPEGFYGYGFGLLLSDMNESINTIINQLIDSGTLQNKSGGFTMKGSGMSKGEITQNIGTFQEIQIKGDDIRKAIMPFQFASPSSTLYTLLGGLQDYANRLSTVTETQTGDLVRSDQTATAVAAAIEQGTKVFSSIHRRNHGNTASELNKIHRQLSIYLDVEEYYKIVVNEGLVPDESVKIDVLTMLADDFKKTLDIKPVSDINIISRQERATKAQFLYNTVLSNPLTANNPQSIYLATLELLRSVDIDDDFAQQVVQLPKAEPTNVSQEEENQKIMTGNYPPVKPTDNHEQHIAIIQEFIQSEFYDVISNEAKAMLQKHLEEHNSYIYLNRVQEQRLQEQLLLEAAAQGGQI